jgi:hypothetical protein
MSWDPRAAAPLDPPRPRAQHRGARATAVVVAGIGLLAVGVMAGGSAFRTHAATVAQRPPAPPASTTPATPTSVSRAELPATMTSTVTVTGIPVTVTPPSGRSSTSHTPSSTKAPAAPRPVRAKPVPPSPKPRAEVAPSRPTPRRASGPVKPAVTALSCTSNGAGAQLVGAAVTGSAPVTVVMHLGGMTQTRSGSAGSTVHFTMTASPAARGSACSVSVTSRVGSDSRPGVVR